MEVKTNCKALADALSYAQGVVERRQVMPILSHVLLEAQDDKLSIAATDLEVGVRAKISATVASPGATTISAARLYDFARNASGDIQLKSNESRLAVRSGGASYSINVLAPDEFPKFPVYTGPMASFLASLLRDMISRVIFCAATDATHYNINGVFVQPGEGDKLCMVATDRKRLAIDEQAVGNTGLVSRGVILPPKGVRELARLLDKGDDSVISIGFDPTCAFVESGDIEFFMRLVEGEYPNFKSVIPAVSRAEAKLFRADYMQALRRIEGLSGSPVEHAFGAGLLTMTSEGDFGKAVEELAMEYSGEPVTVAFIPSQVIEALQVFGDHITLGINGVDGPGILRSVETPGYTHMVMPIRP